MQNEQIKIIAESIIKLGNLNEVTSLTGIPQESLINVLLGNPFEKESVNYNVLVWLNKNNEENSFNDENLINEMAKDLSWKMYMGTGVNPKYTEAIVRETIKIYKLKIKQHGK